MEKTVYVNSATQIHGDNVHQIDTWLKRVEKTDNFKHMTQKKAKKLIRKFVIEKLKDGEWETIKDQKELNELYALKVQEELLEIQASSHQDITEFSDLISVAFSFAQENGFKYEDLMSEILLKSSEKGKYARLALNNLNPENPSNKLYFSTDTSALLKDAVGLLNGVRETFAAGSNEENILMNRVSKFLTKHSGRV